MIDLEQILKDYIGIYHKPVPTHTMKVCDILDCMRIACKQTAVKSNIRFIFMLFLTSVLSFVIGILIG